MTTATSSAAFAAVPPRFRGRRAVSILTSAVLGAALLTGCDLRLETPPPGEPTPHAAEQLRRDAVDEALGLADLAAGAAVAEGTAPESVALLEEISADARTHAEQLGGVYLSGLPQDENAPAEDAETGTGGAGESALATPAAVAESLLLASVSAAHEADAAEHGPTARLLTSIAAARITAADALVRSAALDVAVLADIPAPGRAPAVPDTAPAGVPASTLGAVVLAEDQAGYGFEVIAATVTGKRRTDALVRALVHRDRAEAWARAAGLAGGLDPRKAVYALPTTLADAEEGTATTQAARALAQQMEVSVARGYTTLVAQSTAGARGASIDLAIDAAGAAVAWGHGRQVLPALAEHSGE